MTKEHKHKIDIEKATFLPGIGYKGLCKVCGMEMIYRRVKKPRNPIAEMKAAHTRVRMSKKERLRARRERQEVQNNG